MYEKFMIKIVVIDVLFETYLIDIRHNVTKKTIIFEIGFIKNLLKIINPRSNTLELGLEHNFSIFFL